MKFSDNSMSAVLLCSYIGINNDDAYKPLTLKEWNELLDSVIEHGQQPSVVMDPSQSFLRETDCSQAYIERIKRLMSRAGTVAFQLDELEGKGIDIVTQFDADYPVLMKRRLKKKTPPVLFYSGDIGLAKKIGIGVAGSRNVDAEGVDFARKLVEKAAAERLVVYSGGAKGVDSIAEKAAVESGSAAISFVADSLISKIRKKEILDAVVNRKCLLLSDVRPDVGFSAARAMNRNKYIYASSYGTFVVASDYNKGGTWAGAAEAMKNEWTKVLVWNHGGYEGNRRLIEKGAVPYELSEAPVFELLTRKEEKFQQVDLFSFAKEMAETKAEEAGQAASETGKEDSGQTKPETGEERGQTKPEIRQERGQTKPETGRTMPESFPDTGTDLYYIIAPYVMEHIGEGMTKEEAAEAFHVAKGQMDAWLKRLCRDSRLKCVKGLYVKRS
ncbi:MAG: DNA-processing protein DprA [Lachnospiraceae bacterium]|nr:DNA-processing protein DprA [Lachnospiraceae bacterium]